MVETTDRRSLHLTPADAQEMLRLSNLLHWSPVDPVVRKRVLLDGLCRLVDAGEGSATVTTFDRLTARRTVISMVRIELNAPEAGLAPPAFRPASPPSLGQSSRSRGRRVAAPLTEPGGAVIDEPALPSTAGEDRRCIDSYVGLIGMQVVASLTLCRWPADPRPFSSRQREIVNSFHAEMAWIYGHDLFLTSPEALALPPRQRETLQYLVAGEPEAKIAAKVELSPTTVHAYVRSLYRRFSVRSRGELLTKWAQRRTDC